MNNLLSSKDIEKLLTKIYKVQGMELSSLASDNTIEVSVWSDGSNLYESYHICSRYLTGRGGFLMFWKELGKQGGQSDIQFTLNRTPIEKDELFKIMRYEEGSDNT